MKERRKKQKKKTKELLNRPDRQIRSAEFKNVDQSYQLQNEIEARIKMTPNIIIFHHFTSILINKNQSEHLSCHPLTDFVRVDPIQVRVLILNQLSNIPIYQLDLEFFYLKILKQNYMIPCLCLKKNYTGMLFRIINNCCQSDC